MLVQKCKNFPVFPSQFYLIIYNDLQKKIVNEYITNINLLKNLLKYFY